MRETIAVDEIDSTGRLEPAADRELRAELLRRRDVDQAPRRVDPAKASIEEMRRVSEDNTTWLKAVVAEHGWPGVRMVGRDGADAAWLLAQHADHDLDFQRHCLALVEKAVEANDAFPRHVAYLTDRVLIKEGKRQRYGTQFNGSQPFPIEAPGDVDKRRAAVGLEPLAEYAKHFQGVPVHGSSVKAGSLTIKAHFGPSPEGLTWPRPEFIHGAVEGWRLPVTGDLIAMGFAQGAEASLEAVEVGGWPAVLAFGRHLDDRPRLALPHGQELWMLLGPDRESLLAAAARLSANVPPRDAG